jgi:ribosomal protein L1
MVLVKSQNCCLTNEDNFAEANSAGADIVGNDDLTKINKEILILIY